MNVGLCWWMCVGNVNVLCEVVCREEGVKIVAQTIGLVAGKPDVSSWH